MDDHAERPNRIPWPPILFASALLGSVGLGLLAPIGRAPGGAAAAIAGVALMIGGAALMAWSFASFRHARTTILPHRGADALITQGPFAWSRNPIYLAEALMLAGLGLAGPEAWPLVLAPVFMAAVWHLAISREEAHLAARFGQAWEAYRARVRRWL